MGKRIIELHQELGELVKQMRGILDAAEKEKRSLTAEDNSQYENMEKRVDEITKEIETRNKQEKLDKVINTPINPMPDDGESGGAGKENEPRYRAYQKYLKFGEKALTGDEVRALQADADIYGGFIVAPEQMSMKLIKAIDNQVIMRPLCSVETVTTADSLGITSLDNNPADPAWTKEIGTGNEDSTMSFGKRDLHPHPLAKLLKVSEKLLRVSSRNVEDIVIERLGYKFGVTEENCFLNGTGANQPLGVFTASANGISTGRDVSTANLATQITADGLINCLYNCKEGYMRKGVWIFHRDAIKQIRKLKDGNGQYVWQAGLSADRPAIILDRPYYMSEYAPSTFTASQYVGIFGDFSFYQIADALTFRVQRLVELYAATNQVGFIGRLECDGQPILEEAFSRVKLAA